MGFNSAGSDSECDNDHHAFAIIKAPGLSISHIMKPSTEYTAKRSDIESLQLDVIECKHMIKKLSNNLSRTKDTDEDVTGFICICLVMFVIIAYAIVHGRWWA